jgi:hypothetical protein
MPACCSLAADMCCCSLAWARWPSRLDHFPFLCVSLLVRSWAFIVHSTVLSRICRFRMLLNCSSQACRHSGAPCHSSWAPATGFGYRQVRQPHAAKLRCAVKTKTICFVGKALIHHRWYRRHLACPDLPCYQIFFIYSVGALHWPRQLRGWFCEYAIMCWISMLKHVNNYENNAPIFDCISVRHYCRKIECCTMMPWFLLHITTIDPLTRYRSTSFTTLCWCCSTIGFLVAAASAVTGPKSSDRCYC